MNVLNFVIIFDRELLLLFCLVLGWLFWFLLFVLILVSGFGILILRRYFLKSCNLVIDIIMFNSRDIKNKV